MMASNGREMSMNLNELGPIDESKIGTAPSGEPMDSKVIEHALIFEELVEELDWSDHQVITVPSKKGTKRRSSLDGGGMADVHDDTAKVIRVPQPASLGRHISAPVDPINQPKHVVKPCRRHSSFEPRQMEQAHREHRKMKDYLQKLDDENALKRTNFVEAMLEFNLSVDISMASMGNITDSAAMHFSCPVLSYMDDDEEDSVEMMLTSGNKSRTLGVVEEDLSFEGLDLEPEQPKEDNIKMMESGGRTYTLELSPVPADSNKARRMSRGKKTRRPSYKDLELRLESETPQEIIRSFSVNGSLASMKIDDDYVEKPMASGRITSFADDKFARFRSSSDMQAVFRTSAMETSLHKHGF